MNQAEIGAYAFEHGWRSGSHVEGTASSVLDRGDDRVFLYFARAGSDAPLEWAEDCARWSSTDPAAIVERLT